MEQNEEKLSLLINNLSIKSDYGQRIVEITFSDEHNLKGCQSLAGTSQTIANLKDTNALESRIVGVPLCLDRGAVLMPEKIHFSMIDAVFAPSDYSDRLYKMSRNYYLSEEVTRDAARCIPLRRTLAKLEDARRIRPVLSKNYYKGDFENGTLCALPNGIIYATRQSSFDSTFEIVGQVTALSKKSIIVENAWMSIDFYCSGLVPKIEIPHEWLVETYPIKDLQEIFEAIQD
jgi:hypothetical protein